MADRWTEEREELERMDRERGYGRYRRDRDDYRFDRGLYGDRSFEPRDEHVFGERESGVDYTNPRRDYGYDARMARRQRREDEGRRFAYREDIGYGGDYAPITRGGAYGYSPRPYRTERRGDEHWRDERAYRAAYGDHDHDRYENRDDSRNFWERASDRVASWFGEGDREGEYRGRGPSGYKRTDERISEVAHDRLTDDPWLDASAITVLVDNGEITLSGTVPERESKHRAERLVEDLAGVNHVQNNLRVRRNDPITGSGSGFGDSANAAQISSASSRKN